MKKMFLQEKTKKTIKKVVLAYKERRSEAITSLGFSEDEYKEKVASLRSKVFKDFEERLKTAKSNLANRGFIVHEVTNKKEAQTLLDKILDKKEKIIKAKTNTGREIGLESFLKRSGRQFSETDLGDYIADMFQSEDMHYVLPAIHITPEEISLKIKDRWQDDVVAEEESLTHYLCGKIRENILQADTGITGANFFTCDGEVLLLENEGNISLVSRLPKKHIIICGIDKITANVSDAVDLCQTAAIFGTGQRITQYVSIISGPSKTADIQNKLVVGAQGAQEVHLILIDNGRRRMIEEGFGDILRCINCGACINFCPVYHQIGSCYGGEKYIGSKGLVFSFFNDSLDEVVKKGNFKCTLCGNCLENCPMKIDLPDMVRKIRRIQSKRKNQTAQNTKMISTIDKFGNPFGKIDGQKTPDKLYCC
ncbi:MAG: LUD domain-containing protein [Bacteroidales bacterium]